MLRNSAADVGGGIYVQQIAVIDSMNVTLTDCEFVGNKASHSGGALYLRDPLRSAIEMRGGRVISNEAKYWGGGVYRPNILNDLVRASFAFSCPSAYNGK